MRVELHPDAVDEARAAYAWYAARNQAAAQSFMAELDRVVALIEASPQRWPVRELGTRRILLRRFPFAVVFRCNHEVATILAIAHGRRRPAYWRNRL